MHARQRKRKSHKSTKVGSTHACSASASASAISPSFSLVCMLTRCRGEASPSTPCAHRSANILLNSFGIPGKTSVHACSSVVTATVGTHSDGCEIKRTPSPAGNVAMRLRALFAT